MFLHKRRHSYFLEPTQQPVHDLPKTDRYSELALHRARKIMLDSLWSSIKSEHGRRSKSTIIQARITMPQVINSTIIRPRIETVELD